MSGFDWLLRQRLQRERILLLGGVVEDDLANHLCAQLLLLAAERPTVDIQLWINSPGGSGSAGAVLYDAMAYVPCDVATVVFGVAASMAQFLLAAGTPGKRYALPHARIMMHQLSAPIGGTTSDIMIQAAEYRRLKVQMIELTARHTGRSVEQIERDSDRDRWFTAAQAKEYGILDEVVPSTVGVLP